MIFHNGKIVFWNIMSKKAFYLLQIILKHSTFLQCLYSFGKSKSDYWPSKSVLIWQIHTISNKHFKYYGLKKQNYHFTFSTDIYFKPFFPHNTRTPGKNVCFTWLFWKLKICFNSIMLPPLNTTPRANPPHGILPHKKKKNTLCLQQRGLSWDI